MSCFVIYRLYVVSSGPNVYTLNDEGEEEDGVEDADAMRRLLPKRNNRLVLPALKSRIAHNAVTVPIIFFKEIF